MSTQDRGHTPALNAWSSHARAAQIEFPTSDPAILEIWGYTDQLCYSPGDRVCIHVHTTAARYAIEIFRDGLSPKSVYSVGGLPGARQHTREDAFATGCDWEVSHEIRLGNDWPSGAYVIVFSAEDDHGKRIEREHFFVLRPSRPQSRYALILATGTYTAYNDWGGANHYRSVSNGVARDVLSPRLSLHRPMARGMVRQPADAPQHCAAPVLLPNEQPRYPWLDWAFEHGFSRHYIDAGWASYDRPFAVWAEANGYALDFYTQHDLHFAPERLADHALWIVVGHDEYWSWEMRDALDHHLDRGGNFARFGGNMIWQIRLENEGRTQVCYKDPELDPYRNTERVRRTTTHWDATMIDRPAATTFGLTGLGGCYNRFGAAAPRSSGGLTAYRPDHWVFSGTDLYYGDVFGAGASQIACFEVDGVDYTFRRGLPYATGIDGAPASLQILAMTPAVRGEINRHGAILNAPLSEVSDLVKMVPPCYEFAEYGAGMMAVFNRGSATVFNAGVAQWVGGLIREDFCVSRITRNVLDKLAVPSP